MPADGSAVRRTRETCKNGKAKAKCWTGCAKKRGWTGVENPTANRDVCGRNGQSLLRVRTLSCLVPSAPQANSLIFALPTNIFAWQRPTEHHRRKHHHRRHDQGSAVRLKLAPQVAEGSLQRPEQRAPRYHVGSCGFDHPQCPFLISPGASQQGAPREAQCAKVITTVYLAGTSADTNSIPVRKDVRTREF